MIDLEAERAASLRRLGIEPDDMRPPLCPCGKPVAPTRRKYCSQACLRKSMDYSVRKRRVPWAEEKRQRNERIFALRDEGLTGPQIAEIVNVHPCTVYRVLRRDPPRRWNKTRVSLSVDRDTLQLWKRLADAGDQSVQRFIFDVVSSEAERRTSLHTYLKAGRQS